MEDQKFFWFIQFWSVLLYLNNEVFTHVAPILSRCIAPRGQVEFYLKLSITARKSFFREYLVKAGRIDR